MQNKKADTTELECLTREVFTTTQLAKDADLMAKEAKNNFLNYLESTGLAEKMKAEKSSLRTSYGSFNFQIETRWEMDCLQLAEILKNDVVTLREVLKISKFKIASLRKIISDCAFKNIAKSTENPYLVFRLTKPDGKRPENSTHIKSLYDEIKNHITLKGSKGDASHG